MEKLCPLIQKTCLTHGCEFYIHLTGTNPQTGQPTDEWGCTVRWLPILLVENAAQIRQTAASVDKVATQVNHSRAEFIGALPEEARGRLVAAQVTLLEEKTAPK